jgi:hypothetical protein
MEKGKEKAKLIKEALKIVDELGKLENETDDSMVISVLIDRAKKLTKNIFWKLT